MKIEQGLFTSKTQAELTNKLDMQNYYIKINKLNYPCIKEQQIVTR